MGIRVLFLTGHLPFPPLSGGRRREFELLRRLAAHVDVSVCAVSKTYEEDADNAAALTDHCADVRVVPADPVRPMESAVPFQVLRHRSRQVASCVAAMDHDVVHVEGFYLMQHLRHARRSPTVLVEQNIEYQLWQQRAAQAAGAAARRHRREAERTRRAELAAWRRADIVGAMSDDDAWVIRRSGAADVRVVPDGIDAVQVPSQAPADGPPVLTYVANFAYEPNVDAAVYFVRCILPAVVARVPEAHLMLVGNAPPQEVTALTGRHVTVTGRVPDVTPYLRDATVVVCPLRIGGGVKVKMLEALSHGKAIVATTVGTQGLGDTRDAVVAADDARQMTEAIVELLLDGERRRRLERAAVAHAATLPTWEDAAEALLACYEDVLDQGRLDA